ncbi:unnamed protein product [Rotaria magnacalcarata]|uniref:Uncharacterized protein n=1 Tax=Rotaria magnacalcarata TaxID=392030 RepID=A0A815BS90_9BILA|nr:unnamed protein product [Rotaria magnacalcarata]
MYKVKFAEPVKNIDDLYSMVKDAYIHGHIPTPYPAANKQLQSRLTEFVSKGISGDQSMSFFDKVNSKQSAPKCHKRLNDVYCISNKRIRLIQRTIAKFILPDSSNDENTNDDNPNDKEDNVNEDMKDDIDDGDDDGQSTNLVKMSYVHKQSSLPPSSHHSIITTRSKSK